MRFKYEVEPYGVLLVSMLLDGGHPGEPPVSESAKIAAWQDDVENFNSGDPCYIGYAELVTIKGTKTAYVGGPPDGSRVSINWREGPVSIHVHGPILGRDQAIEIANKL